MAYTLSAFRRHRLQRLFSSFPEGWPGVGLILLRLIVALNAILEGIDTFAGSHGQSLALRSLGALAILAGAALLTGFLTPLASASAAICFLATGLPSLLASNPNTHNAVFTTLNLAALSIALVMLGPGAFSFDARLFGRREIFVSETRRPPRC